MTAPAATTALEDVFRSQERQLWGLCYRMTGVAADADELVQEAFAKALEHGSALSGRDLERWLLRVTTNLSLDCLRRRRRRRYPGSWLPGPVETPDLGDIPAPDRDRAELRYESAREVSYAWLVALEALQPRARAVLLLRELLDCTPEETAELLGTSEGNVRVLHHRARNTLRHFDPATGLTEEKLRRQRETLESFVVCMMSQDVEGMKALLADSVRSITDAGGRYTALREPLEGRDAVVRFHLETARRRAPVSFSEIRDVNGSAALVVSTRPLRRQMAPRLVLRCELDDEGRIRELHTVLAPRKLTAVRFPAAPEAVPVSEETPLAT